jgi:phenylalanyl-tRNA synthetase alpha chain
MKDLRIELADIRRDARSKLAGASSIEELVLLRAKYLGRKGSITKIMREIPRLPQDDRPSLGRLANELKQEVMGILAKKRSLMARAEALQRQAEERIDVTMAGRCPQLGRRHPITQVLQEIVGVFVGMGFRVVEGPEVETDYYNFEALNMPPDHPARGMLDTFYVSDDMLLRSHTSPVQIRVMEKASPPLRIISPGKVYRYEAIDASHVPMFHQVEGFMIDEHITFGDLKGVLEAFIRQIFGKGIPLRFRPSFFPYTEPSAEVEIGCLICEGKGCSVCKGSGWLEILGSGMIDPSVFCSVNYDPERFTGFAFGMGVERIAMLKYGIDDIRLFFENDLEFLRQF